MEPSTPEPSLALSTLLRNKMQLRFEWAVGGSDSGLRPCDDTGHKALMPGVISPVHPHPDRDLEGYADPRLSYIVLVY